MMENFLYFCIWNLNIIFSKVNVCYNTLSCPSVFMKCVYAFFFLVKINILAFVCVNKCHVTWELTKGKSICCQFGFYGSQAEPSRQGSNIVHYLIYTYLLFVSHYLSFSVRFSFPFYMCVGRTFIFAIHSISSQYIGVSVCMYDFLDTVVFV